MSDLGPIIVFTAGLILIGALVSLTALLSPVRRWCRRGVGARIDVICTLGLVSFVIGFGLWTRLTAEAIHVFGTFVTVDTFDAERIPAVTWPPETQVNKPAVVSELWKRLLIPPSVRRACYAGEASVCEMADSLTPGAPDRWGWKPYLRNVGIACVPVLTCTVLAGFFTRRRDSG